MANYGITEYGTLTVGQDNGLIGSGSISFASTDNLTVEKITAPILLSGQKLNQEFLFLLAVQKDPAIPYNLTVNAYNVFSIDGSTLPNVFHSTYTLDAKYNTISGVTIGTGNGSTTSFSGTLASIPICQTSVSVAYTIGTTNYTATDNGNGTITGTDCSGTINYETGAISLTFSTAPASGDAITVSYYQGLSTYQDFVVQGLFVGYGEAALGFKFAGGVGPTTIYYKIYRI